jgi:hypothetical protein
MTTEPSGDFEEILRILQDLLVLSNSEYRFSKLDDGPLPAGTIEVELDEFWSQRDTETALRGLMNDHWLTQLETHGWVLTASTADGRTFWIRPTTVASIVEP